MKKISVLMVSLMFLFACQKEELLNTNNSDANIGNIELVGNPGNGNGNANGLGNGNAYGLGNGNGVANAWGVCENGISVIQTESVDENNSLFVAFRSSDNFLSYNENLLGKLDLLHIELLHSDIDDIKGFKIPITNNEQINEGHLITFFSVREQIYFSLVPKYLNYSINNSKLVSGVFSLYLPNGELMFKVGIKDNFIYESFMNAKLSAGSWGACMQASMNLLMNDWENDPIQTAACWVWPHGCMVGAAIACGLQQAGVGVR